jgi:hypothetical protein
MVLLTIIAVFKEKSLEYIWILGGIYGVAKIGFPVLCGFLLGHLSFPGMAGFMLLFCGGICALADISEFSFLMHCFFTTPAFELVNLVYEPLMFALFQSAKAYAKEFLVAREFCLNAGRIFILVLLMCASLFSDTRAALKWFLIGLMIVYFAQTLVARNINSTLKIGKNKNAPKGVF